MDLFEYLEEFQVLVCRSCAYAVPPTHVKTHLSKWHKQRCKELHAVGGPGKIAQQLLRREDKPLRDPLREPVDIPTPDRDAIPLLAIHSGLQCNHCPRVTTSPGKMSRHIGADHTTPKRAPGRPTGRGREGWSNADWHPVSCQRFFLSGPQSMFFAVVSPAERSEIRRREGAAAEALARSQRADAMSEADFVWTETSRALEAGEQRIAEATGVLSKSGGPTEVSPWLELTRWSTYLHGHNLADVATLADPPNADSEPTLAVVCSSLDRIVEEAHRSVCNDRINVFDQARINSFLQRPRAADRPLLVKLKKSTYSKYKSIGKRLLCFVHRTIRPEQSVPLQHRLTPAQMTCYDRMLRSAEKCLDPETPASEDSDQPRAELDRQCLRFFTSLLDHDLRGSMFESAVVGFLAVLGIDRDKNVLKEAYHYTPTLSGFIKISQLVVLQEAVIATEEGMTAQPADLLDDMRDRFMVHGTRSPFSRASRLRTYGKQVRDSTTCLGYIAWTKDAESVSYKDLQAWGMAPLRKFVKSQIESAQSQLEGLLLLHSEEQREDLATNVAVPGPRRGASLAESIATPD